MPGFFETLNNLPLQEKKKFFLNVEGKQLEVSLEKKIWGQHIGEKNLTVVDGKIVNKPKVNTTRWKTLQKADKGIYFVSDDIHWPEKVDKGGVTWQVK
tara:strand:- start:482 stop:775 length:294 start_codon:yes stop_codon:yes gene_type:complete